MKKIKSIKYRVELSYKNTFIFDDISNASAFMSSAIKHAEDPEDVERFEINTIIEYFPTPEEIKEQLNEKFGVASSDKDEDFKPIYCDTDSLKETKGGDKDV